MNKKYKGIKREKIVILEASNFLIKMLYKFHRKIQGKKMMKIVCLLLLCQTGKKFSQGNLLIPIILRIKIWRILKTFIVPL